MRVDDIPLFSMLKGRLRYLDARQKVIAENVANANTPGFTPRDIKPPQVDTGGPGFATTLGMTQPSGGGGMTMAMTRPGHMLPPDSQGANGFKADKTPDSETRLDGNSVVLEEEMLKMAESRMAYDAAITFYQKSMNLLRMASKSPSR